MAKKHQDINQDVLVQMAVTDSAALGVLYDIYYDKIFRYCVHRLRYRQVAEDVTSNIFLSVAGGIKRFRGKSRGEFAGWLYQIAGNQINQYLRDNQKRQKLIWLAAEKEMQKTPAADTSLSWPQLHSAILELNQTEQEIITLRYFEGMTSARIAEITEANPNTVRVRLLRAIEKLKGMVSKDELDLE